MASGIRRGNGRMFLGKVEITNFEICDAEAYLDPVTFQVPLAVLVIVSIFGDRIPALFDLEGGSFETQLIRQHSGCRTFGSGDRLEAYILDLAMGNAQRGIYFRRMGWEKLWTGKWVYVAGKEVLGDLGDHDYLVSPRLASIRLAYDPDVPMKEAVGYMIRLFRKNPETVWQVYNYAMLSALHSIATGAGLTTFFALFIVGYQGLGKTFLVKHYGLLYDRYDRAPEGEIFGFYAGSSTPKGIIQRISDNRDTMSVVDDLPISSDPRVQKERLNLVAEVLRFAANGDTRETASKEGADQSRRATGGVGYTGEIRLTEDSDLTRVLLISLDKPMSGGSELDRAMAATTLRGWLTWVASNAEVLFPSLKIYIQKHAGGPDDRFIKIRSMMEWVTDSFFSFAEDLKVVERDFHVVALEREREVITSILSYQKSLVVDKPLEGNLAFYILKAIGSNQFHFVLDADSVESVDDCIMEGDTFVVTMETLLTVLNRIIPGAALKSKLFGKKLRKDNIITSVAEGKSAARRIKVLDKDGKRKRHRFLELNMREVRANSRSFGKRTKS